MKSIFVAAAVVAICAGAATASKWDDLFTKPRLRAVLERTLKDVSSVQYRSEILTRNGMTLCGEFNAKNSYGAYAGFKRFIAEPNRYIADGDQASNWHGDDTQALINRLGKSDTQYFEELWAGMCV